MCAFGTPWGRECFTRMPFGLDSASEVLQERNNRTFGDIPNVHVIADDLIAQARPKRNVIVGTSLYGLNLLPCSLLWSLPCISRLLLNPKRNKVVCQWTNGQLKRSACAHVIAGVSRCIRMPSRGVHV